MRLIVERNGLKITGDNGFLNPLEEAFIEEILGLQEDGDSIKLIRRNAAGLNCISHLETEEEELEVEIRADMKDIDPEFVDIVNDNFFTLVEPVTSKSFTRHQAGETITINKKYLEYNHLPRPCVFEYLRWDTKSTKDEVREIRPGELDMSGYGKQGWISKDSYWILRPVLPTPVDDD